MKLISVFSAAGQLNAEMIKAFLEAKGIEVILNQESIGRTYGLSAGTLGEVDILVPESQVAEAKAYLKAMVDGEYANLDDMDISEEDEEE
ncbi:MAG: putative signal transducing protein [Anaerolineales bacterium]